MDRLSRRILPCMIFAGALLGAADGADAQVRVRAPFVDVTEGGGGVRVRAPFVDVQTDSAGTRVWAPFTHVHTNRGVTDSRRVALPTGLATVRVELEGDGAASSSDSTPPSRPAPSVRAEQNTRQGSNRTNGGALPADAQYTYAPHVVVPLQPGQARPNMRVVVESNSSSGRAVSRAAAAPEIAANSKTTASSELKLAATSPARPPGHVVRLQPAWHTEVPNFFQPAAGIHVFALVHPHTRQTVPVEVELPPGHPRIRVGSDELEFDYGRTEVEIRFRSDGRVVVKRND